VAAPLHPVLVGAKRPKKAHLFPALKNLVPMATERAGGEEGARGREASCRAA